VLTFSFILYAVTGPFGAYKSSGWAHLLLQILLEEKLMSYYFCKDGDVDWFAFHEEREADYKAIGRANVLLMMLKFKRPKHCRKYQIVSAGKDNFFPLYAVRKVGLFGSKEVPFFTRGRMVEVERQLREGCEHVLGRAVTDEELDEAVRQVDMSPITNKI